MGLTHGSNPKTIGLDTSSSSGTRLLFTDKRTLANNNQTTLISETVPGDTTRELNRVTITARASLLYEIFAGGSLIGSGRLGPAKLNDTFIWLPQTLILTGILIEVKATRLSGPNGDVETYLMAKDFAT